MPRSVSQPSKHWTGKNRGEKHPTVGYTGFLQRQSLGSLEVFNGERAAKWEYHRVEKHAHQEQAPEGSAEPGEHGDERRVPADPEQEPSEHHDPQVRANRRQQRANKANCRRPYRHVRRAVSIRQDTAQQCDENVRQAVDGVEGAYIRVAETELPMQEVRDGGDCVVNVVAAKIGQADQAEDPPPGPVVIPGSARR